MTKAPVREIDSDRLLDAAARLFRRRGFDATTVREIATEAEMLPGSLHYRFATKEDLLLALMERGLDQVTAAIRDAIAGTRDPTERLRLALRAHLRVLLSGDDAMYVLLFEWRSLSGDARTSMIRLRDRYEAFWDGMMYEAAGAGRLRPRIDLKLARLFGFGAINWAAQWFSPDGDYTPEQIADTFWAFMTFGLLDEAARLASVGVEQIRGSTPRDTDPPEGATAPPGAPAPAPTASRQRRRAPTRR